MGLGIVALVVAFYVPTFIALAHVWQIDPNYTHGYFVPLVSAFFARRAWRRTGPPWQQEVGMADFTLGVLTLAGGIVLHIVAGIISLLLLDVFALVAILRGILLILGGKTAVRGYGFSALFLLFMAPLPIDLYQRLAGTMQQIVSSISATALTACGVPTFREGYLLHLSGCTLEVGEACSGLRQLTAFLALTVAVGHLSNRSVWFKLALVVMSGFIAIAANCVRILVTAAILLLAGPRWAEGVFHAIEGLAVILVGLVLLIALAWALGALEDRVKRIMSPPLKCGSGILQ